MSSVSPLMGLTDVCRVYRTQHVETHALKDLSLRIDRGEFVAIQGPSGSGKSTLLSILGLLDKPTSGQFVLAGVPVHEINERERARLRNQEIGFVFQAFNLIQDMTVTENVTLPLTYRKPLSSRVMRQRAESVLERVGLGHRSNHYPTQLSGGQQQRTALARALIGEPSLLLADEPTGNLDTDSGEVVMGMFQELNAQGTAVVMVTHDAANAARAKRRIRIRDGCIEE